MSTPGILWWASLLGLVVSSLSSMINIATYVNKLSFCLYRELSEEASNFIFSPYSLSHTFGMIYAGASERTAEEIESWFGFDSSVHQDFKEYSDRMVCSDKSYMLTNDNVVLIDKSYNILYPFRSILKVNYDVSLTPVCFCTNGCKLRYLITNWVLNKTDEMIEVFKEDCINPNSLIFIISVLYFNANWNKPFSREIKGKFFNNGVENMHKFTTMFCIHENIDLYECERYSVVRIPFEFNILGLIIIIPTELDGMSEIENTIDANILQFIIQHMQKHDMKLCFPKFSVCHLNDYSQILPKLGLSSTFCEGARFGRISPDNNLFVSSLVNVDKLEIGFNSGSGAAYFAPDLEAKKCRDHPKPHLLCVNHPFLFFIVDYWYDMILFAGRIREL